MSLSDVYSYINDDRSVYGCVYSSTLIITDLFIDDYSFTLMIIKIDLFISYSLTLMITDLFMGVYSSTLMVMPIWHYL